MYYLNKILKTEDSYSPIVLRVALGLVMFPHGAQKVLGWFGGYGLDGTLGFLTQKMGLPMIIALLVIAGEFLGPLALMAGFLTRFSAASIGVIMAGAVVTVHLGNGFFMNWSGKQAGEGFEYHILMIGIAIALSISGGGKYSLDQWISEKFFKKV
jgi:putative oxidoreductase